MKTKGEIKALKTKNPEPYSDKWERLAGSVARNFAPSIYPCKKCNYPVVSGYVCSCCGSANPYEEDD